MEISPVAAELMSIKDSCGTEYLWQGDPSYWARRAFNIFPYVGRLTDGCYNYAGARYKMRIHGFLPETEMSVESATEDSVCYFMRDNGTTLKSYPFPFELRISYALAGCRIDVSFDVRNTGGESMYFGAGGHPGFRTPIEDQLAFGDYCLEFAENCSPVLVGMSDTCYVNGLDTDYPLLNGTTIPLRHDLFDNDAIILRNVFRKVTLRSGKGTKSVTVSFPDMPFVGFWHWPKKDAPYICVEPWTSLPSRDGVVEDIATQPDLISLEPGGCYINKWSIEVHP